MEKIKYLTSEEDIKRIAGDVIEGIQNDLQKPDDRHLTETLFTAKEVCEIIKCSKQTLNRWMKNGLIPYVKIGANIRFKKSDLDNLLKID